MIDSLLQLLRSPKKIGIGLTVLCLLMMPVSGMAQQSTEGKPAKILFLLDASSSMLQDWQDTTRFRAAATIIASIMDSIYQVNDDVAFGLRVFGSQYPAQEKNCFDTRLEVPFGYLNKNQIITRLKYLHPRGYSPIALSLKEAAEQDFVASDRFAYSIILITDGGESCGGDICKTVETLLKKKISFKPFILSLVDYAPLEQQYDCLGQYIVIANPSEIAPAIHQILNANRTILSVKRAGLQPASTPPPVIRRRPVPEPIDRTPAPPPEQVVVPEPEVTPVRQRLQLQQMEVYDRLFPQGLSMRPPRIRLARIPDIAPITVPVEAPPTKVTIQPKQAPSGQEATSFVRESTGPITPRAPDKLVFRTITEDAAKTRLRVYFTNGKGKFYSTEPKMVLKDAATGQEVKTVFRIMSGSGPAPIDLPAGVYDIIIPGSEATAVNVTITENKLNNVYIKVGNGSLAFYYPSDPKTPPKQYTALVSQFNEGGPVVKQVCSQILPYEPDNYHIEINTLPPLIYNIDLTFNQLKLVAIPKPGTVQIVNTENIGKVQFWHPRGRGFVPFLNMDVYGNPERQQVDLLPGTYQVRYYKLPVKPYQEAEVVVFQVKSDQKTTIYLQP